LTAPLDSEIILPPSQIEELLRSLVKAQRAFQMYLPNNPIYHRASDAVREAFRPVWGATDEILLTIRETEFVWEDTVVYSELNKADSLAWQLYKDGMRFLTLKRGVEEREIVLFLQLVNQAKLLPADAGDDLSTILWEQDFEHLDYRFPELFGDGPPMETAVVGMDAAAPQPTEANQEVADDVAEGTPADESRPKGVIDPDDFDSTLYFLDEREEKYLAQELEREYTRDLRMPALAALLDIFELQRDDEVRDEIIGVLENLFPNLLNGGEFKTCAMILRDTRSMLERVDGLTDDQRSRLSTFDESLSEPAIVDQLLQSLDEGGTRANEDDIGELLKELKPQALETLVLWLPRLASNPVKQILNQVSERLAANNAREVLRLLRSPDSEALPGVVDLCGRLALEPSVAGLGEVLGHDDPALRLAAVNALGQIGSPGALGQLDRALKDRDRDVRLAAVKIAGQRGFRGVQKEIELVVFSKRRGMDFTERRGFFEAYGSIVGNAAVKPLAALLLPRGLLRRKRHPEIRMCAALGLGRVGTPEAREILERVAHDRDRQVRNAVQAALRAAGR